MSKEFAAMEEAALKAYEEDLKRMQREADGKMATLSLVFFRYVLKVSLH